VQPLSGPVLLGGKLEYATEGMPSVLSVIEIVAAEVKADTIRPMTATKTAR
jgi:hypothetical protein